MKLLMYTVLFCLTTTWITAQTTPDEAVNAALQNNPILKAAVFDVEAKKHAEKTALNVPNPEVNTESPTGEFYTIGVLQSFEFPTVYSRQKKVAQAETSQAMAGQQVSENDLRFTIRFLYLEAQVAEYKAGQWRQRDTLYQKIADVASRKFAGGEIDFLQKTLADNEAGKVRQEKLIAEQMALVARQQLVTYTGLEDLNDLLPLNPDTLGLVVLANLETNPNIAFQQLVVQVAEKQVSLAKSRALPNFSLGYLNQGASNTPMDYRFRASMGLPLWAGQYNGGRKAAESEAQSAKSRAEAVTQVIQLEYQRIQAQASAALSQVKYHQTEALPRSKSLISTAIRLREAGQLDYLIFLRSLDEAYAIQREYTEQVRNLNAAQLQLRRLTGQ